MFLSEARTARAIVDGLDLDGLVGEDPDGARGYIADYAIFVLDCEGATERQTESKEAGA